jgi:rod shape determining protein RodA
LFAKFKQIDIVIVVLLLLLMVCSILLVESATLNSKLKISVEKNVIVYVIGLIGFIVMSIIDYKVLLRIHFYSYAAGILLLISVYFFGKEINGAKGWFTLPGGLLDFQPAELMKVILIVTVAAWLYKRQGDRLELKTDIVPIGLLVLLPFVLVLIQPDLGNAIIYLIILLGMVWIGNIKYTHVLIGLVLVVGGFELFLFLFKHYHDPIKAYLDLKGSGHWVVRIDTFLDPANASKDALFQVKNSIHAIGSGGLAGEGYMKGSSIQSLFIPYAYSDSIFVVVGEEFGFRGTAILLLLYFILIYRMIQISLQSAHLSGSYIVAGVVSMFVFQIFENVGMLIGIMPLTGITLPFISYGGTSLLINMLSLGLVMSVKLHQERDPFSAAEH